jgi:hypothetical protein
MYFQHSILMNATELWIRNKTWTIINSLPTIYTHSIWETLYHHPLVAVDDVINTPTVDALIAFGDMDGTL